MVKREMINAVVVKLREEKIHKVFSDQIIAYIEKLNEYVEITGIILHGSVAKRKAHPKNSDIDLIIVSPNFDTEYRNIVELRMKIAKFLPSGIDALWIGEKDIIDAFESFTGMLIDALYFGIILYDEKGILNKMKITLEKAIREGKIKRIAGMWTIPKEKLKIPE